MTTSDDDQWKLSFRLDEKEAGRSLLLIQQISQAGTSAVQIMAFIFAFFFAPLLPAIMLMSSIHLPVFEVLGGYYVTVLYGGIMFVGIVCLYHICRKKRTFADNGFF